MRTHPDTYADRILSRRTEELLTQADLAAMFGVSTRTVQNWETGTVPQFRHQRAINAWLENGKEAA